MMNANAHRIVNFTNATGGEGLQREGIIQNAQTDVIIPFDDSCFIFLFFSLPNQIFQCSKSGHQT